MARFPVGIIRFPNKKMATEWIREEMHRLRDGEPFSVLTNYVIKKLYPLSRPDRPSHFIVSRRHAPGGAPAVCPVYEDGRRGRVISYPILLTPQNAGSVVLDEAIKQFRAEFREQHFGKALEGSCDRCGWIVPKRNLDAHHSGGMPAQLIKAEWLRSGGSARAHPPGSLMMVELDEFRRFHNERARYELLCVKCHKNETYGAHA